MILLYIILKYLYIITLKPYFNNETNTWCNKWTVNILKHGHINELNTNFCFKLLSYILT